MNKRLTIKDLENPNILDEITEYFFGIDDNLERMILQFIFKSKNYTASMSDIREHFVYKLGTCTTRRLYSRIESLLIFKFIDRKEINNHTFYNINDEWLKSIRENTRGL